MLGDLTVPPSCILTPFLHQWEPYSIVEFLIGLKSLRTCYGGLWSWEVALALDITVSSSNRAKVKKGEGGLVSAEGCVKTWAQTRSQLLNSSKVSDISVHGTPTLAAAPGIPKSEEPRDLQMPTQKTPGDSDSVVFAAASPLPPGSAEGSTDPEHRSHPSAARPIHTS